MLKIINLVTDQYFINALINLFDLTLDRGVHKYVILGGKIDGDFKYIKQKERIDIMSYSDFIEHINHHHYDALIIHGLKPEYYQLVLQIPSNIQIVWKAWGFDIYYRPTVYNPFLKLNIYRTLTKHIINHDKLDWLKQKYFYWRNKSLIQRAVHRIDFFSGVLPYEYDLMSELNFFQAKRVSLPYRNPDSALFHDITDPPFNKGSHILLGNSGDPSNNHLDAIELLSKIDTGSSNIYCPLSYGGAERYKQTVIATGEKFWHERFIPLTSFMPKEEYQKIIASCSVAIFYHERQQALGNINTALWQGCKVFLSPTSATYKSLCEMGLKIYDVETELDVMPHNDSDKLHNRRIMLKHHSIKVASDAIYDMYNKIEASPS